jgi:hypothetical protein
MTLRSNPFALRRIAAKLIEKAEDGELAAIQQIADRLDGKPAAQVIDRRDVPVTELSDEELLAIAAGALPEREEMKVLLLPPGPKSKA